ncbi:unnamed protein product [Sphenostylis stenocarpa]|uniref:beta-fructofuranosidase n=1 Tax=Sphenostylis stenocarpa TaxID=92480 RepID=A0AA86TB19_9FABA|nr:unnamed protein product [Sphenostylis stenocarpa]
MEVNLSHTTSPHLDHGLLHTPLLNHHHPPRVNNNGLKPSLVILCSIAFLMSLVALIMMKGQNHLQNLDNNGNPFSNISSTQGLLPRGVAQGVSAKSNPTLFNKVSFNWTNAMFSWQRTAFHFQPQKNWMNDPDGTYNCNDNVHVVNVQNNVVFKSNLNSQYYEYSGPQEY